MKPPKILPRVAAMAGIEVACAERLWAQACDETHQILGENQSSDYWKAAVARLLDLLEAEKLRPIPAHFTPWIATINAVRMMPAVLAMQRMAASGAWSGRRQLAYA